MTDPKDDIDAIIDHQLNQGVAVSSLKDGTMIFFQVHALEKLLEAAKASPSRRVAIFAKKPVAS